jgi:5-methylcytosine-specific restriction endonuclease McrA
MFSAPALDQRKNSFVSLTNIAGMRVIQTRRSLLRTDKNPYLIRDEPYFTKLKILRSSDYFEFSRIQSRLVKRQKGLCAVCGDPIEFTDKLEVDHITPLGLGGSDNIRNLRLIHFECHRRRVHGTSKKVTE